ncbi:MAG: PQQ-dependent dehydrogenase, methanol/ethanol family [Pseudoxanthomonas sp.]
MNKSITTCRLRVAATFRAGIPPAIALALAGLSGATQAADTGPTWQDLRNDADTPDNVLTYGMGAKMWRHSNLTQINKDNVTALRPVWSFSFGDEKQRGQESQAMVYDGVIYISASYSRLYALDQKTGKKLWEYKYDLPGDIRPCCDVVSRGVALYGDKVFLGTLDAGMVALDRKTGKEVWKVHFGDQAVGYSFTGAPFIVKEAKSGKVLLVHGNSGDEFGALGTLYARDPDTGKEIWSRPMVQGHQGTYMDKPSTYTGPKDAPSWPDGDYQGTGKVEAWSHGGGAPWQTGVYDAETNTIIIGTGNPGPWNTWKRTPPGGNPLDYDSLYTSGQAYVDASTGDLKGFYAHTPNDAWDFSGNNLVIPFEYKDPKTGKEVKASAHADRNGFFFVTDRAKLSQGNLKEPYLPHALINAWPFVQGINWAEGISLETGKPIETGLRPPLPEPGQDKGKTINVQPNFLGASNWMPMSYNPDDQAFYIPANEWKMDYWTENLTYKPGAAYLGQGFTVKPQFDDHVGVLTAISPLSGKILWRHEEPMPLWSGTMNTAGGLVFFGTLDGYLKAADTRTGKILWQFQTGSGVVSQPITWTINGKQYVGIASGAGGAVPIWAGKVYENIKGQLTQGSSFWVFALPDGLAQQAKN